MYICTIRTTKYELWRLCKINKYLMYCAYRTLGFFQDNNWILVGIVKADVKPKDNYTTGLTLRAGHWERMVIKECGRTELSKSTTF